MGTEKELFKMTGRIRAIAQNGLIFSKDEYDTERYEELLDLSNKMTALLSGNDIKVIESMYGIEKEYATPKVDVRGVIVNDRNEVLMVKEKADGKWALPGGWADAGFSAAENVIKEIYEETGLNAGVSKVLAVFDKSKHADIPPYHFVYRIAILCHVTGGSFNEVFDILDKGYFAQDKLPPLSERRITKSEMDIIFEYINNPSKPAMAD